MVDLDSGYITLFVFSTVFKKQAQVSNQSLAQWNFRAFKVQNANEHFVSKLERFHTKTLSSIQFSIRIASGLIVCVVIVTLIRMCLLGISTPEPIATETLVSSFQILIIFIHTLLIRGICQGLKVKIRHCTIEHTVESIESPLGNGHFIFGLFFLFIGSLFFCIGYTPGFPSFFTSIAFTFLTIALCFLFAAWRSSKQLLNHN